MEIESLYFKYPFRVKKDSKGSYHELYEWLAENCEGQYLISVVDSGFRAYSPTKHESPFPENKYPPAHIDLDGGKRLIIFENEDDAARFKLTFAGEK